MDSKNKKGSVSGELSYIVGDVKYAVDGRHVVLKPSDRERSVAVVLLGDKTKKWRGACRFFGAGTADRGIYSQCKRTELFCAEPGYPEKQAPQMAVYGEKFHQGTDKGFSR